MSSHYTRQQLEEWDRQFLWHPFTQMKELDTEPSVIIKNGSGIYITDIKGRTYIDGVSSLWVNLHGHQHPILDKALRQQIRHISHSTLLGLSNPPAILLARKLIQLAPPGLTKVFYSDDGSTAMEVALKMAIQYWQQRPKPRKAKTKFVHMGMAYHGDTAGDMSISGIDLFHSRFRNLIFPTYSFDSPYCYRCPLHKTFPSCNLACVDPLEALLSKHHARIAGVIVEPMIQGVAGMVTAPPGHLRRVRELCTQYEVLMIADEVATGFGRTGRMFACEHESVSPDLMAVAKGITGGYLPLAATLATNDIFNAFLGEYHEWKTFFHGHSYTGNPLGCVAALANLEIFQKERTLQKLQPRIQSLHRLLQSLKRHPQVGDIRQCGYMAGIELVANHTTREPFPLTDRMGHRVGLEARKRGLLIRPIGNVLVLMPPLVAKVSDLRTIIRILVQAIQATFPKSP
jgi:adenosylmethionine-8-amino-7-oxononanoate aminotransferase